MAYVDKREALRNLSNPNDFNIYKNMFIKMYDKDLIEKIKQTYQDNQFNELYELINNINRISLNIGSNVLFSETKLLLNEIDNQKVEEKTILNNLETIDYVYQELKLL